MQVPRRPRTRLQRHLVADWRHRPTTDRAKIHQTESTDHRGHHCPPSWLQGLHQVWRACRILEAGTDWIGVRITHVPHVRGAVVFAVFETWVTVSIIWLSFSALSLRFGRKPSWNGLQFFIVAIAVDCGFPSEIHGGNRFFLVAVNASYRHPEVTTFFSPSSLTVELSEIGWVQRFNFWYLTLPRFPHQSFSCGNLLKTTPSSIGFLYLPLVPCDPFPRFASGANIAVGPQLACPAMKRKNQEERKKRHATQL